VWDAATGGNQELCGEDHQVARVVEEAMGGKMSPVSQNLQIQ
jgi:hypothetical protein